MLAVQIDYLSTVQGGISIILVFLPRWGGRAKLKANGLMKRECQSPDAPLAFTIGACQKVTRFPPCVCFVLICSLSVILPPFPYWVED